MENQDIVSRQYTEAFNVGYIYSSIYYKDCQRIVEENKGRLTQDGQLSGLLAGMQEFLVERHRSILNDLDRIRNEPDSPNRDR